LYIFHPDISTIESSSEAALSGVFPIPFLGDPLVNGINSLFGFNKINVTSTYSTLAGAASKLADGISAGSKIAELTGHVSKLSNVAGKASNIASILLTGINVFAELTKTDSIGMDQMIKKIIGNELSSSTHEGVAALYTYAKLEMLNLRKQGVFSYETNGQGLVTSYRYKDSDFDTLRQELRTLKDTIEQ
jgi:hypothetical protein